MTEEEKETIEQLKSWRNFIINNKDRVNKANDIEFYLRTALNLIQSQQKETEKKDKIIDLISEKLAKAYHYKFKECSLKEKEQNNIDCDKYKDCTSCVKQYFGKKVEENDE